MAETTWNRRNIVRYGGVALIAAAAVAVYVTLDGQSNTADAACALASERASTLNPYATGQLAGFRVASNSRLIADLDFQTPEGEPRSIADFSGRVVLVNLWATWCGPCREEMPALDQLAATFAGDAFEIVPVSLDTSNTPTGPGAFFDEIGISSLDVYVDPTAAIFGDMRELGLLGGLPTTILVDETGCTLGVLEGPAEWAGPDGVALIEAAIGG